MQPRQSQLRVRVSSLALGCVPFLLFSGLTVVRAGGGWYGDEYNMRGYAGGPAAPPAPGHWNPAIAGQVPRPAPPPPPAHVIIVNKTGYPDRSPPPAPASPIQETAIPVTEVMETDDSERRKLPRVRGVKRTILGAWLASAGLPFWGALSLGYGLLRLAGSLYDRRHVQNMNEARAGQRMVRQIRQKGHRASGNTTGSH
ncbi:hypothetical protein CSUI_010264 [Cystoisospora suis]|uniref:Transmembrane protein n=1 Tax=Cystoisospora suis TaxID=483139 RepID=A0A2C6KHQ0_9APIC|nr:hypothetical protein CSUI_010264 [Cystoisospora suis]